MPSSRPSSKNNIENKADIDDYSAFYYERDDVKLDKILADTDNNLPKLEEMGKIRRNALEELNRKAAELTKIVERNPNLISEFLQHPAAQALVSSLQPFFANAAFETVSAAAPRAKPSSSRRQWSDEPVGGRNPSQFIRDEYSSELAAKTLTLAMLRQSEKRLYNSYCAGLSRWRKLPKNRRDPNYDLHLPTDEQRVAADLKKRGLRDLNDLGSAEVKSAREAERLRSALRRRI